MTHPPQTDAQFVAEMAKERMVKTGNGFAVSQERWDRLVLLAAQPTWQPMETAPTGEFVVLVDVRDIRNGVPYIAVARKDSRGHWITTPGAWRFFPTHWMPVPAAPAPKREP